MNVSDLKQYTSCNKHKHLDAQLIEKYEGAVKTAKTMEKWTKGCCSVVDVAVSIIGLEEHLKQEILECWIKENKYLSLHHHLKMLSSTILDDTNRHYIPLCLAIHSKYENVEMRARNFYSKLEQGLQKKQAEWAGTVICKQLGSHERITIHMDEKDPEKAVKELEGIKKMVDDLKLHFENLKEEWHLIKGELKSDLDDCILRVYVMLDFICVQEYEQNQEPEVDFAY